MTSVQILFGILALLPATIVNAASSPPTIYRTGKSVLVGTSKSVCVIQGKWANGQPLNYQAWDKCPRLSVIKVIYEEVKNENSYEGDRPVAAIPRAAEIFRIGNENSEVLLYQDERGETRSIMISD